MPMVSADSDSVVQHCAACGANNRIEMDSLELGHAIGQRINPDVIVLPACGCGATEALVRTWDTCPDEALNSHLDLHRKVVNGLAQYLKAAGSSHTAVKSHHDAETIEPPDQEEFPFSNVDPPVGAPPAKAGRP